MASTTIYSVKSTLLTKLKADATLSAIQVTYGDPGGAARREHIFIGDVTAGGQDPESLSSGRRRRIESYTLDVIVSVQSKPQGLQENEQRAIVLASAVENARKISPEELLPMPPVLPTPRGTRLTRRLS